MLSPSLNGHKKHLTTKTIAAACSETKTVWLKVTEDTAQVQCISIPGCSIQKFSLNYDHRVESKYLIYLKGAVMTVLIFYAHCF